MKTKTKFTTTLGARLRAVREWQGLSLNGVERKSGGRWKGVIVGSYERGDRAAPVEKLAELADFYGVPIAELLPAADAVGYQMTGVVTSADGRICEIGVNAGNVELLVGRHRLALGPAQRAEWDRVYDDAVRRAEAQQ